ncbi:TPA: hypothetical protein ACH3X3_013024 [Trebouxia sp. C0006]
MLFLASNMHLSGDPYASQLSQGPAKKPEQLNKITVDVTAPYGPVSLDCILFIKLGGKYANKRLQREKKPKRSLRMAVKSLGTFDPTTPDQARMNTAR